MRYIHSTHKTLAAAELALKSLFAMGLVGELEAPAIDQHFNWHGTKRLGTKYFAITLKG
jgi:hypothetical protein